MKRGSYTFLTVHTLSQYIKSPKDFNLLILSHSRTNNTRWVRNKERESLEVLCICVHVFCWTQKISRHKVNELYVSYSDLNLTTYKTRTFCHVSHADSKSSCGQSHILRGTSADPLSNIKSSIAYRKDDTVWTRHQCIPEAYGQKKCWPHVECWQMESLQEMKKH